MTQNNLKKANLLKGIQSQIDKAESEYEALKIQQNQLFADTNYKKKQIYELRQKLKSFEVEKNIKISEHAILRYLERVKGVNIDEVISEISTEKLKKMVDVLGNGTFPIDDKFSVKVKNNVVITVLV